MKTLQGRAFYTAFRWDGESGLSPLGDDPNNAALSFETIGREKGHLSRTAAGDSKVLVCYSDDRDETNYPLLVLIFVFPSVMLDANALSK